MSDGHVQASTVTIVDVFAKQVEMGAQLGIITEQLKALPDHEARLRALEKWRYSLPFAALASGGSVALSVWSILHH